MSTVATRFTKFQVGAAAAVITAATVLTPAAIAQARPDLVPAAPVTDLFTTNLFGTDAIQGPVQFSLDTPWWWENHHNGATANAAALVSPVTTPGHIIFQFTPLALVPGFLRPLAGWFTKFIPNFSICFAGLGLSVIGPYATVTLRTGAC